MERKRTVRIVLNPTAGRGAGRRLRAEVERELAARGIDVDVHETERPGHAADLAAAAVAAGADVIVAVGGDGTIHEVVNGLMRCPPNARPALGLIPVGTGNDLVKVVAGTRTRAEAYDTIAHGWAVPLDAGRASWAGGEEYFVNAMGTGIDVEVVRQIRGIRNLPGAAVYVLGLAKALVKYRPLRLRVTIDGVTLDRRFMMAAVANGCCVGGAFQLCPDASPDDGLL
ncbi:MAG: diacylglycerol/lipid kinase family protein, partial [Longimicrobiales bacterium]